mgnify:CR=1 FL=1
MNKSQINEISLKGLPIALAVIIIWLLTLSFSLSLDLNSFSIPLTIFIFFFMTFLYTGLFITAHDAMHGIVFPKNKKINDFIGTLSVLLYALFSFKLLLTEHHKHHDHSGTLEDPDFHDGQHKSFFAWYYNFLSNYISWKQILGMAILFNILLHLLKIPVENLILFWVAPSLLSTFQLFFFGTYLPHREGKVAFVDKHNARSNNLNTFLSFITCYHFGYHLEHHRYPYVPWWKLPSTRK